MGAVTALMHSGRDSELGTSSLVKPHMNPSVDRLDGLSMICLSLCVAGALCLDSSFASLRQLVEDIALLFNGLNKKAATCWKNAQELAQSNDLPLPVPVPTRCITQNTLSQYWGLQEFHANFREASFYETQE